MNKKRNVAVIGSGPAGLSLATKLVNENYLVTVFDELKEFGGMIAYGIPEFRIPLKAVKEKISFAKKCGVIFKRKKINSIKPLLKNFDYIVLAIGAGVGSKAGFVGENNLNAIDALDFLLKDKLENKKLLKKREKVAVIGGGNSAVDAARVALRQGAKATVVYRRTESEMPALRSELELAKKDKVEFKFLLAPLEFISNKKQSKLICSEMILGEIDSSGRRKPIDSGKRVTFDFDKVILAIGQEQDYSWLEKEGIKVEKNKIIVNSEYKTNLDTVYACGDCVSGPKTIAEATVAGIKCANAIINKEKI